jgi:hypothetical protein
MHIQRPLCLIGLLLSLGTSVTAGTVKPAPIKAKLLLPAVVTTASSIVAPSYLPAWPVNYSYPTDRNFYVSPAGNDANDGSQATPYATLLKAIQQVKSLRNAGVVLQRAGIFLRADGQNYAGVGFNLPNHVLISVYGQANSEQRATLVGSVATGDAALAALKGTDIHLQNLRLVADSQGCSYGFYNNGGDDNTLDYCEIDGFRQFDIYVVGLVTGLRIHHCYIANSYDASSSTMNCSGLHTEAVRPNVRCNIFYHNGWRAPFDMNNGPQITAMAFRHGWDENPGVWQNVQYAVGGTDQYNLYLRNAATGHLCQAGDAKILGSIFWDNGNAADAVSGAGVAGNKPGEIGYCVVFGNITKDYACWGGGIKGESAADYFHDLRFLSDSRSMQLAAALSFDWQSSVPVTAVTATITNCKGVWNGDALVQSAGRTTAATGLVIRKPVCDGKVPTFLDWMSVAAAKPIASDDQAALWLRTHLRSASGTALAAWQWTDSHMPN